MDRQQKSLVVASLEDNFNQSKAAFVVGVQGLSVKQLDDLRMQLRKEGAVLKIAKARLMKRAVSAQDSYGAVLSPLLKNQIGLVFALKEAPSVAKVVADFSSKNKLSVVIGGVFEQRLLHADDVRKISLLPSREILLARLCGAMKAPITNLARVCNLTLLRLLQALSAIEDQKRRAE